MSTQLSNKHLSTKTTLNQAMAEQNIYEKAKEKLSKEIDELEESYKCEISQSQAGIDEERTKLIKLEDEIKESESEVQEMTAKAQGLGRRIQTLQVQIAGLQSELTEKHFEIQSKERLVKAKKTESQRSKDKITSLEKELDEKIKTNVERMSSLSVNQQDTTNEKVCDICMEEYDKKEHFHSCISLCGHRFGKSCLEKTLLIRKGCPICNKNFKPVHIIRLF